MFVVHVNPATDRVFGKFYALPDRTLDRLVDSGIDTVVFQEPTQRLVSDVSDWQSLGEPFNDGEERITLLSISFMEKC